MTSDSHSPDSNSDTWSRKKSQLVLVVVLALLLLSSYYLVTDSSGRLPSSLGDLTLTEEKSGDAARQMIDRLHGTSVTPTENVIGVYDGSSGKATLYLSVYADPNEAGLAKDRMADRIRKGNAVFGNYEELTVADHPVLFCRGLGQVHYFFSTRGEVYWLAVDESAGPTTIASLVSYSGSLSYTW